MKFIYNKCCSIVALRKLDFFIWLISQTHLFSWTERLSISLKMKSCLFKLCQNLFTFLDLDLDDLLSVCTATLSQPLGQAWSKRMTNLGQGWANGQYKILKVVLKTQNAPEASNCAICIETRGNYFVSSMWIKHSFMQHLWSKLSQIEPPLWQSENDSIKGF